MAINWHSLELGDLVVVIDWPQELNRSNLHEETVELYDWLIETGAELVVDRIDHLGLPYGKIIRQESDVQASHYLALNHGGIELAGDRRSRPIQ
jgi:hypothetical protein